MIPRLFPRLPRLLPLPRPAATRPLCTTPILSKALPPRPKPPPDSEIEESYLKGSGPGGQKIVRPLPLQILPPAAHPLTRPSRTKPTRPSSSSTHPPASSSSPRPPDPGRRTASTRASCSPKRSTSCFMAIRAGLPSSGASCRRGRPARTRRSVASTELPTARQTARPGTSRRVTVQSRGGTTYILGNHRGISRRTGQQHKRLPTGNP